MVLDICINAVGKLRIFSNIMEFERKSVAQHFVEFVDESKQF